MTSSKGLTRRAAVAGIAGLAAAAGIRPALAQTVPVKFASVGGITDAGVHLADEYGWFKEGGLAVEMLRMNNAPSLTAALATNQVDVAGISITPGLFASVQQDVKIKIVGDKQSLRPGFSATRLVVRPALAQASEGETVKGLKGRKIAISAKASSVYLLMLTLLQKYGMQAGDVHFVELSYPNMVPAMASGAVDAAVLLEPFLSQAISKGEGKVGSDLTATVPPEGESTVPLVYSEKFAADRKNADAFMLAYMRGVRAYNDAFGKGRDKEKAIEILARRAKLDPDLVRNGFAPGLDPDQRVRPETLARYQDFFLKEKFLREPVDLARIVDTSFAEAAVRKLGAYR